MSPTSRGRKGRRKTSTQQKSRPTSLSVVEACDCPECSGTNEQDLLVDGLLEGGRLLLDTDDPTDAELLAATFASVGDLFGEELGNAFADEMLPRLESASSEEALAALLAIGSITSGQLGTAAAAAAGRLIGAGISRPRWADELAAPVTADDFRWLRDDQGAASMLVCSFHRAERSQAILVNVDQDDCGAAESILVLDATEMASALEHIREAASDEGIRIRTERLNPEEFRWQVENALAARAVHDADSVGLGPAGPTFSDDDDDDDDDDGPAYPVLAALVRARMAALPVPGRPPAPHPTGGGDSIGRALTHLPGPRTGGAGRGRGAGLSVLALPPKRKKTAGPAPIYQIKVGLRGAKPPIWRRLEVPADVGLDRLHAVIQTAFDWYNEHLHVFETPYGSFGAPDANVDYADETAATLEQVAPTTKAKICYRYDFGDDWEHDIVVEKILDPDPAAQYPRCTGGERAGPPEDCGGVWGYAELLEVLSDPDHPDHDDRLEWLDLVDAEGFDPEHFETKIVNLALSMSTKF